MSLREREAELAMCKEELMDKEIENVRLSLDKVKGQYSNVRSETNFNFLPIHFLF